MGAFSKLLIANRGEIAVRVARAARARGLRTVAVYSDADAQSPHVAACDEAVRLGGAAAAESYLDIEKVIEAARRTGAEAVHPGYGFLAENAAFAQACAKAGLVFVGPEAETIRLMGDKAAAKRLMIEAGVPVIPGYEGEDQSDATLIAEAARIGFPLMVKAAAGGGGKGMRRVESEGALAGALQAARREAKAAFGDDTLLLEKAIEDARHVEVQVLGDTHGAVIAVGERDCSVQRRHQKVIEEAPCPALTEAERAAIHAAAVRAAEAVRYVGAGTVEFLREASGTFYFLEMNTRIQVEHPVSEMVHGVDLVGAQLDIAAGGAVPLLGLPDGHAIEARLYAEDPYAGFLPQAGALHAWRAPSGEGVRVDHALADGVVITPHYDPMLAKVIAHGRTREEARLKLIHALTDTVALGPANNKAFLIDCLRADAFAQGEATTGFIAAVFGDPPTAAAPTDDEIAMAGVLHLALTGGFDAWRSTGAATYPLKLAKGDETTSLSVEIEGGTATVAMTKVRLLEQDAPFFRIEVDGVARRVAAHLAGDTLHLDTGARVFAVRDVTLAPPAAHAGAGANAVTAPMSGKLIAVRAKEGEAVTRGQVVAVLEAMKMEHELTAPRDGVVARVAASEGAQLSARDVVVELAEDAA